MNKLAVNFVEFCESKLNGVAFIVREEAEGLRVEGADVMVFFDKSGDIFFNYKMRADRKNLKSTAKVILDFIKKNKVSNVNNLSSLQALAK